MNRDPMEGISHDIQQLKKLDDITLELRHLKLWMYVIFVGLLAQFFRIGQ